MEIEVTYSRRERTWLWGLAAFGFLGVNAAFLYGAVLQPELLRQAWENPLAAAFMVEAFVLVALLAYLFAKWGVSRIRWEWFVLLALLGSLAFAIPVALLFPGRESEEGRPPTASL